MAETRAGQSAHFDASMTGVVISHVVVTDADVVREAQRWTTGERGPIVDDSAVLASANLVEYVTEAVKIGAHALSAVGHTHDAKSLEQMIKDLGDRTARTTNEAVEITERAAKQASDAVTHAADTAGKALHDAEVRARKELATAVVSVKNDLSAELRQVFGGENPELVGRLQPILDQFGTRLDARVANSTSELIAKVGRQFDPADPTSPMAKHQAALDAQRHELAERLAANHKELTSKVDELTTALKIREAKSAVASVTPIKGDSYAHQVHHLLASIASGLGDEYVDASANTGKLPRSRKGDGVLTVNGDAARVVVEMTDSARKGWTQYLDEAERNRDAAASLGLVRMAEQNDGHTVRCLGPRRIVMAFDPEQDDPDLLRTVVMVLRTACLTASSRSGAHEIATAEEKVTAALAALADIDEVKKVAEAIGKNANKIENQCSRITTTVNRLLNEALDALGGTAGHPAELQSHEGAA